MSKTTYEQWSRRKAIAAGLGFTGAAALLATAAQGKWFNWPTGNIGIADDIEQAGESVLDNQTKRSQYRGYTNLYELSTNKTRPVELEHLIKTDNWMIEVDGKSYTLDQIRGRKFEDLESVWLDGRCIENWSMRASYNCIPMGDIIREYGDPSKKYVAFTSVHQKDLPGVNRRGFKWPYVEGFETAEVMNPLCKAVFGNYGEPSPVNGSPFRIFCPWKYMYKSAKLIVKIECTDTKPPSTWSLISPSEYGFYSNVNPAVHHPRWSTATERHITSSGTKGRPTRLYNGYGDQVAHLYPGNPNTYR